MKKNFYIVITAALLFSKSVIAQDTIQTETKTDQKITTTTQASPPKTNKESSDSIFHHGIFGVRFMPTFSSLKVQNSGGVIQGDFVLSYGYGALLGVSFNKHIGLQLEVIYNQLSQKYKDNNLDRKININYVNVPLLLSLNTNRASTVNLNIVVGPQLGFNVGSKIETTGTSNGSNVQAILAVKKNDFGIAYGVGLDFGLNRMHTIRLDIGFRGVAGLIDVSDRDAVLQNNSYYILKKTHIETYSGYAGFTFLF